jgi:hypothetical protein
MGPDPNPIAADLAIALLDGGPCDAMGDLLTPRAGIGVGLPSMIEGFAEYALRMVRQVHAHAEPNVRVDLVGHGFCPGKPNECYSQMRQKT